MRVIEPGREFYDGNSKYLLVKAVDHNNRTCLCEVTEGIYDGLGNWVTDLISSQTYTLDEMQSPALLPLYGGTI